MKLYSISDSYINYLKQFEFRVMSNTSPAYTHTRKYLGVIIEIDSFNYFCPLSSGKISTDHFPNGQPRPSIVPIIRMIDTDNMGSPKVKSTLLLNNMIPVPLSELIPYNHRDELDLKYRDLINFELEFIHINRELILKNAHRIYKEKIRKLNHIGYIKNTVNFKLLESKHNEWIDNIQKKLTSD